MDCLPEKKGTRLKTLIRKKNDGDVEKKRKTLIGKRAGGTNNERNEGELLKGSNGGTGSQGVGGGTKSADIAAGGSKKDTHQLRKKKKVTYGGDP